METNKGIIIKGGQVGNASVGDNNSLTSKIEYIKIEKQELQKINNQVDEVLSILKQNQTKSSEIPQVIASVENYKKEVNNPKPESKKLIELGKSILDNLKYITMLPPIAQSIWQTVTSIIR